MVRTRDLVEKYLASTIEPTELAELERLLRDDPAAAEMFVSLSRLESNLHACFQQDADIRQAIGKIQAIESAPTITMAWSRRPRIVWSAAGAFLVTVCGLLFSVLQPANDPAKSALPLFGSRPFKVVAGNIHVNGQEATSVHTGDRLRIVSGQSALLSLPDGSTAEFENASEVVFRGEVGDMNQVVELFEGAGTFRAESGERLFQVETPVGRITALGAEFRVALQPQGNVKERVFPSTKIAAIAVLVVSGVVEVQVGSKTHTLYAGDDRRFPAAGESSKAIREALVVLHQIDVNHIVVTQGGDHPKKTLVPLNDDVRIFIDGKPGRRDDMAKGMTVYLQRFLGADEVIGLRVEGPTLTGTLRAVEPGAITLSLRKGREGKTSDAVLSVSPDAKIEIDGRSSTLAELLLGSSVIVKLSADQKSAVRITVPRIRESERRR